MIAGLYCTQCWGQETTSNEQQQEVHLGISTDAQLARHSVQPICAWVDGKAHRKPHTTTILEDTCISVVIHGDLTTPRSA